MWAAQHCSILFVSVVSILLTGILQTCCNKIACDKQGCNTASDSVTRVAVPPDSLYSIGNPRKTLKCKNFIPSGNVPPMNVLEKNDIKTVMHFAKVCDGAEYM